MAVYASLKARARGVERDVLAALEPSGYCNGRRRARFGCEAEQRWLTHLIQAVNQRRPHSLRSRTDVRLQGVSAHRVIALEGRFTDLSATKLARHRHREPLCLGSTSL